MTILQHSIAQAAAAAGGYQIARSLRFNSADSAYLARTPASAGNQQKFTLSFWLKRTKLGSEQAFFNARSGAGTPRFRLLFNANDTLQQDSDNFGQLTTTQVFRDVSSWYHIVFASDSTQATDTNRKKLYVNGTQVTTFGTSTYPTQNTNASVNSAIAHDIGVELVNGIYFNGYIADARLIDGQQLDPTSFGEFDANTGVWNPKTYSGTYGTNGFWLKFDDNSGTTSTTLGKDSSGNANNWTPNNFSVTAGVGNDSLVDTPTNYGTDTGVGGEVRGNYATLNPLRNELTLANGNIQATGSNTGAWKAAACTFGLSSGKWYWEINVLGVNNSGQYAVIGVSNSSAGTSDIYGSPTNSWIYDSRGSKQGNGAGDAGSGTVSYGASYVAGDTIGVALDMDAGTLTFYKNNTSQGVAFNTGLSGKEVFPWLGLYGTSASGYINFGQRPFAYTAPSGFKALCTQNLPTPAIGATSSTLANKNFDALLWTGAGQTGSASVTGLGFQPDFVWTKQRSGGNSHLLYDSLRGPSTSGASKALVSNATAAEGSSNDNATYGYLSAFNSNGFSYFGGSSPTYFSSNGATHVAWNWNAGNSSASNTSGSVASTVRANPTAGISIATYTAPSASGDFTFGHGLGVAPKLFITRFRSTSNWAVYHESVGANAFLKLNATDASTSSSGCWGTGPTSSLITVKQSAILGAAGDCIAYAFAEVAGFSKFGSYTGNGSADGTFVYCGFRPRWVLIRNTGGGSWELYDTARDTYNQASLILEPNASGAEQTAAGYVLDILSNGFKLRGTASGLNSSGATYIFAAFAEAPFNYSRAR